MATCAGCGISSKKCGYTSDDRVEDDGTYANKKFVCDECYIKLIWKGLDVGTPLELQERAAKLGQQGITNSGINTKDPLR